MIAYGCDCGRWTNHQMSRLLPLVLAVACTTSALAADSEVRRRVAQAAERHARAGLMRQIRAQTLSPTLTVGSLTAVHPALGEDLDAWVDSLRPFGPVRWGDDAACEVTVQVAVQSLLAHLRDRCRDHDVAEPSGDRWDRLIAGAGRQVLRATGVASAPRADAPDPSRLPPIWRRYSDRQDRLHAAESARTDAARKLLRRFERHRIANGVTGGHLLGTDPAVRKAFERFCARTPAIGRPTYRPDVLIVDVRLELTAADARRWLVEHAPAPAAGDAAGGGALRALAEQARTIFAATGSGTPPERLSAVGPAARRPAGADGPAWPPVLQAAGCAPPADDASAQARLRTMRNAEDAARKALTRRVEALPIAPSTTVGRLMDTHVELRDVVGASLAKARRLRSRWTADGRAEVIVELPTDGLRRIVALWQSREAVGPIRRTATRPAPAPRPSGRPGTAGETGNSRSGRTPSSGAPTAEPSR